MVDRVGEWYAFSRSCYCRRLTLYDGLLWKPVQGAGTIPIELVNGYRNEPFDIAMAAKISVAPFGGPVAVLSGARLPTATACAGPLAGSAQPYEQEPYSAEGAVIFIYTSAAELLTIIPLVDETGVVRTRDIVELGWTMEGELCVLTSSLLVLFVELSDIATVVSAPEALQSINSSTMTAVGGSSSRISRRVELSTDHSIKMESDFGHFITATRVTSEGILCVGRTGSLYGLLHQERQRSTILPPIPLLLPDLSAAKDAAASFIVSAVDMVPPEWNDNNDFILLWAQYPSATTGDQHASAAATEDVPLSFLCAMVLPDSTILGGGGTELSHLQQRTRVSFKGRALQLTVNQNDPTRVALLTSLGITYVFHTTLSATLYAVDFGLLRMTQEMSTTSAASPLDFNTSFSASIAFLPEEVPRSILVGHQASSNLGTGGGPASPLRRQLHDIPFPQAMQWCGLQFLLLHFYTADFSASPRGTGRAEDSMFSLLVCTQPQCSVRVERLDWPWDGRPGHVASVVEADGVRVFTNTSCYLVQEVPACLTSVCRVQPPYAAATQVVLAYQAYQRGDRRGIAQVRAALTPPKWEEAETDAKETGTDADMGDSEDEMTFAGSVISDLLEAASYELDPEQQYRLVAAASFAAETTRLRSDICDVIVDVAQRLRVLRGVREAEGCHMPLSMKQYSLFSGGLSHPARQLNLTECYVLVDRLCYLGYYQLALDVARAMHLKPDRVLIQWSCSWVRRGGRNSDRKVHRGIREVLTHFPMVSCVEAAATAFKLNRKELVLLLLADEHQHQQKKVMLCLEMGELAMAGQSAALSGSADLVHVVTGALVKKAVEHRQFGVGESKEKGDTLKNKTSSPVELAKEIVSCFMTSPTLLCWLLVGAACFETWQSVAQRLLLNTHWGLASVECHHLLRQCLEGSTVYNRQYLQRCIAGWDCRKNYEVDEGDHNSTSATFHSAKQRKATPNIREELPTTKETPLPTLMVYPPSSIAASTFLVAAVRHCGHYISHGFEHAEMLRCSCADNRDSLVGHPLAEFLTHSSQESFQSEPSQQPSPASASFSASAGYYGVLASTVLSKPSFLPSEEKAALVKEEQLFKLKSSLAKKFSDVGLMRVANVVDLIRRLCRTPESERETEGVRRRFKVKPKMFMHAKLRGLCDVKRFDAVESLLGPPPPLRSNLFRLSSFSKDAPCIGYLAAVQLLVSYHQDELASRYVAGACSDAAERVGWYMSLGAPIMALEAAMVERDPDLIQQVMRRSPPSSQVQFQGSRMLKELEREE